MARIQRLQEPLLYDEGPSSVTMTGNVTETDDTPQSVIYDPNGGTYVVTLQPPTQARAGWRNRRRNGGSSGTVEFRESDATSLITLGANEWCELDHNGTNWKLMEAGSTSNNADTVTVSDAAADTTTFPMLATAATGDLTPRTDAGISYNASTNVLTVTGGVVAALTGDVTGSASGNISKTVAGELDAITAKASLTANDIFLIEDSAASNAKKKTLWSTIITAIQSGLAAIIDTVYFYDPADSTKRARIDVGNVTAGQTRVITVPDRDITLGSGGWSGLVNSPTAAVFDDFSDASLAVAWTELDNDTNTTVTEDAGRLKVTQATHAGEGVAGIFRAAPGDAQYAITAHIGLSGKVAGSAATACVFVAGDLTGAPTTAPIVLMEVAFPGATECDISVVSFTDYNNSTTLHFAWDKGGYTPNYLRIWVDNTANTYSFLVSKDGQSWVMLGVVTQGASTLAVDPSTVGVGVHNVNSGADASLHSHMFRVDATANAYLAVGSF
jgi:hypothetical protein